MKFKTLGFIRGLIDNTNGGLIAIPVFMDGPIQDVPKVVTVGKRIFICVGTNPLTYREYEPMEGKIL